MYGVWRKGEKVSYECLEGDLVKIEAEKDDRKAEFTIHSYFPNKCKGPFIICMHPIAPIDDALNEGYAVFVMDTIQIATDDTRHLGAFYDIYPYKESGNEQTGVLMAWAWGASKVLDAVYAGLGKKEGLDEKASMVTGVSRWGKATAVCGAFDDRFAMTIPTCSGAGGLALYNYNSEGKTYDFEKIGGPKEYTYTKNEPLDCLQSEAERGWFNDGFLQYKSPTDIPYEQDNLITLAMDKDRYYFVIAACMGEDWVNAPAMWECYKKADKVYEKEGLSRNLAVHFHKEGHAVISEDMELIIRYFNHMYYGDDLGFDMEKLKTTVFS
ncbi:MAG: hypothetical protein K5669_03755 [Lachnospiraceae bacterium]|nr:hypothetical protein [Lachnospiraceae bacterium]